MARKFLSKSARWFTAAAAFMLLTISGCIPVAWLPDSSGFIYTDGTDLEQLVHYDVAKGERRVLVEKMSASTFWPAVSPDGKKVAVARLVRDADQSKTQTMQVFMYDLQGKEIQRSTEFPWTKEAKA
jgi:Tol biopolymer transport system component